MPSAKPFLLVLAQRLRGDHRLTLILFIAVDRAPSLTIDLWLRKHFTSAPTADTRSPSGSGVALTAGSGAPSLRRCARARRSSVSLSGRRGRRPGSQAGRWPLARCPSSRAGAGWTLG